MSEDLKRLIEDGFREVKAQIQHNADVSFAAHEEHRKAFDQLRREGAKRDVTIRELWRQVQGSLPPPDPPSEGMAGTPTPTPIPLQKKISDQDLEIDAVRSDLINFDRKVDMRFESLESKFDDKIGELLKINRKQNEINGTDKPFLASLFASREGKKQLLSIIAMIVAAWYVTRTGQPPPSFFPLASPATRPHHAAPATDGGR